jgi:hypothetical protein
MINPNYDSDLEKYMSDIDVISEDEELPYLPLPLPLPLPIIHDPYLYPNPLPQVVKKVIPKAKIHKYKKPNINQAINFSITTDGIYNTSEAYANLSNNQRAKLVICDFCTKCYEPDVVFKDDPENILCWHCFFWMNYDINKRADCDGTQGVTIVDYILKCGDKHKFQECTRNSDHGGCFLCEYKNGLEIENIKQKEKLYGDKNEVIYLPPIIKGSKKSQMQDNEKTTNIISYDCDNYDDNCVDIVIDI